MSLNNNLRCYICFKKLEFFQPNISTQNASYTETPIKTYLEQFAKQFPLTENEDKLNEIIVCEECLSKINDYDLACLTARNIENDLCDMLKKTKEIIIKQEIKEEHEYIIENEFINTDEFKNADEVRNTDELQSSEDEKPLVNIKKEIKKISVKRKRKLKTISSDITVIKARGRPRTRNKIVIRNAKSSIPDSDVPKLLKCLICSFQVSTVVAYKVLFI